MSTSATLAGLDLGQLSGNAVVLGVFLWWHYKSLTRRLRTVTRSVRSLSKRLSKHERLDNRRFDELHQILAARAPTVYPRDSVAARGYRGGRR